MTKSNNLHDAIIDTAVALASRSSWEAVRLFDIAAELDITLDDIRLHFREKEDLVDGWFDRADSIMLNEAELPGFLDLSMQQRLHRLIMAWLNALTVQRKVTKQMIYGKFEPGHLHIQIPGLMRISRTVQWVREAAQRDATFVRRALEETGLTTIYLMTFFYWMNDESANSQHTRQFLDRNLSLARSLDHAVYNDKHGQPEKMHQTAAVISDEIMR